MATLHLINRRTALVSALEVAGAKDTLLLIADAVYAATCESPRELLVIDEDVRARGLETKLHSGVRVINYGEFVDLAVAHQPVISWD